MMDSFTWINPPPQTNEIERGECICSGVTRYVVRSFLGKGTFGKVAKCISLSDMKTVAIKMMKNQDIHAERAKKEISTLLKLRNLDPDKCNIVRWSQAFMDRGHICLEFEQLDKSLKDLMMARLYKPFHIMEIRPIVKQLANALGHLKALHIIHADLKLENVMLVNHAKQPYRVKLIDFGLACSVSDANPCSYTQTRPYRSPEVIIGHPFTEATDMWSLGCLAATLYLSKFLYPGRHGYDMIRYIVETQGQLPESLLNSGRMTGCFFQRDLTTGRWKLKSPEQFYEETGIQPLETRTVKLSSLNDLLHMHQIASTNSNDRAAEMTDISMFVDMLKEMLHLDAIQRITPYQVLQHRFISMVKTHPSVYYAECVEVMGHCQEILLSNSGTALEHGSSMTVNSDHQNWPPVGNEGNNPSQPHCISSYPHTTQTTRPAQSGVKRKRDEGDSSFKRTRLTCDNEIYTAQTADIYFPSQSHTRPSIKRKLPVDEDMAAQHTPSDHNQSSCGERQRFQKKHAPSTSWGGDQTQSCISTFKSERSGLSYGGTATCSSSSESFVYNYPDQTSDCCTNHFNCTQEPQSTRTERQVQSGVKRKREEGDSSFKRTRIMWDNEIYTIQAPNHSCPSQSHTRPSIKRKLPVDEDMAAQHTPSDHNQSSCGERQRFQKKHAPSTSWGGDQTQSCISTFKSERSGLSYGGTATCSSSSSESFVYNYPDQTSDCCTNHFNCTQEPQSTRTERQVQSGVKRKREEGDSSFKRTRIMWDNEIYTIQAPNHSCPSQSHTRPSIKRKLPVDEDMAAQHTPSDHNQSSCGERQRFQENHYPSISWRADQTQSCSLPFKSKRQVVVPMEVQPPAAAAAATPSTIALSSFRF